jgi:hypothetical protein
MSGDLEIAVAGHLFYCLRDGSPFSWRKKLTETEDLR